MRSYWKHVLFCEKTQNDYLVNITSFRSVYDYALWIHQVLRKSAKNTRTNIYDVTWFEQIIKISTYLIMIFIFLVRHYFVVGDRLSNVWQHQTSYISIRSMAWRNGWAETSHQHWQTFCLHVSQVSRLAD